MTVVSAMKFNNYEAAIVADELITHGYRRSKSGNKITLYQNERIMGLVGVSGVLDILNEITSSIPKVPKIDEIDDAEELATVVGKLTTHITHKFINGYLKGKYDLSEHELQAGMRFNDGDPIKIQKFIIQDYADLLAHDGHLYSHLRSVYLLMVGADSNGTKIFELTADNTAPYVNSIEFGTVGSGSDVAELVLQDFIEAIPRDKRNEIPPIDGLTALINATDKACNRNVGVEGTPLIRIVKQNDDDLSVLAPTEENSRLAAEIVRAERENLLPKQFREEALQALLYEGRPYEPVERRMWREAKDKVMLDRTLRGYKIDREAQGPDTTTMRRHKRKK